jgi:uncharacterized membrane protein YhaH (DUF805 family)
LDVDWTWYLFSFKGRISDAKWWLAILILFGWLVFLIFTSIAVARIVDDGDTVIDIGFRATFTLMSRAAHHSLSPSDTISLVANLLGMPVLLWIVFATSIKRLHDRDRSGWWIVPFFVLPNFSEDLMHWLPHSYLRPLLHVAMLIVWIWGLVEMGFLRGTQGTNRFGPDPLDKQVSSVSPPHWDQMSELEIAPHIGSPPPAMHVKRGHD